MERGDELFRTVSRLAPSELAAFEVVARHGGFRSAARATGASASALSHAVAGLERRLKAQLFLRSTRAVSLTEAGRRFLEGLQPALAQIDRAVAIISGDNPTGVIRLNSSDAAIEQVMAPTLVRFLKINPGIQLDIFSEGALVDLAKDGFDCGIRLVDQVPGEMIAVPIGSSHQQHIVVGSPSYLNEMPTLRVPLDLLSHQCIQVRLSADTLCRWEFAKEDEVLCVKTNGRLVVDSTRLALAASIGGLGLSYVTRWLAREHMRSGRVVQVLEDWTPPYPGLALYYPRSRHLGPAMRALVDFLRRERRDPAFDMSVSADR